MSEPTIKEIVRESSLGFHFINTFQNCPRKWYIKYLGGILPSRLGKALILGKAWHSGMEVFYRGSKTEDSKALAETAYLVMLAEITENRLQFRKLEDFDEVVFKLPILFRKWYDEIGVKLHEEYDILFIEEQFEPKVGNQFTMTIRPDAVVKKRSTGEILIPEHKTTGYSIQGMLETVEQQDQATAYGWGLLETHPELRLNFGGVLLDIVFSRASAKSRDPNAEVQQVQMIRSKFSIAQFEIEMLGLFQDLARRIKAYDKGVPDALLFPRNGSACSTFGCEYADICRTRITPGMVLGSNYFVDPWAGRETLFAQAEESCESGGDRS